METQELIRIKSDKVIDERPKETQESIRIKSDKLIDGRARYCPESLLAAKIAFIDLKSGQILELVTSHEDCKVDVPKWAEAKGHEYLGFVEDSGYYRFYIKKA